MELSETTRLNRLSAVLLELIHVAGDVLTFDNSFKRLVNFLGSSL